MRLLETSTDTTGESVTIRNSKVRDFLAIQCSSADPAAVINIQGRLGAEHEWFTVKSFIGSGVESILWMPFLRAEVTTTAQVYVSIAGS